MRTPGASSSSARARASRWAPRAVVVGIDVQDEGRRGGRPSLGHRYGCALRHLRAPCRCRPHPAPRPYQSDRRRPVTQRTCAPQLASADSRAGADLRNVDENLGDCRRVPVAGEHGFADPVGHDPARPAALRTDRALLGGLEVPRRVRPAGRFAGPGQGGARRFRQPPADRPSAWCPPSCGRERRSGCPGGTAPGCNGPSPGSCPDATTWSGSSGRARGDWPASRVFAPTVLDLIDLEDEKILARLSAPSAPPAGCRRAAPAGRGHRWSPRTRSGGGAASTGGAADGPRRWW